MHSDGGGVGVAPRRGRHHRGVHHPQAGHATHPSSGSHTASRRRPLRRSRSGGTWCRRGRNPFPDPVVVVDLLTGHELPVGDARQRLPGGDLPGNPDPGDQHLQVVLGGEVGGSTTAWPRVGRGQGDPAPAAHVDGADQGPDRPLGGRAELGQRAWLLAPGPLPKLGPPTQRAVGTLVGAVHVRSRGRVTLASANPRGQASGRSRHLRRRGRPAGAGRRGQDCPGDRRPGAAGEHHRRGAHAR